MKPIVLFPALCVFLVLAASPAAGNDYGLCFGNGGTIITPPLKMPAGLQRLTVACRFKALALPPRQVSLVSQSAAEAEPADKGLFRMDLTPRGQIAFTLHGGQGAAGDGHRQDRVQRRAMASCRGRVGRHQVDVISRRQGGRLAAADRAHAAGRRRPSAGYWAGGGQERLQASGLPRLHRQGCRVVHGPQRRGRGAGRGRSLAGNEAGLAALFSLRETAPTDVVRTRSRAARRRFPPCWSARAGAACRCGISLSPPGPSCTSSPTTCLRAAAGDSAASQPARGHRRGFAGC